MDADGRTSKPLARAMGDAAQRSEIFDAVAAGQRIAAGTVAEFAAQSTKTTTSPLALALTTPPTLANLKPLPAPGSLDVSISYPSMNRAFKLTVVGLLYAAALPFSVVDASAAGKISFKLAGKDPNFAEIKPALSRLLKACPDILRYQDDMEWIKASSDEATAGHVGQDHGWTQWVSFQVKVKDDPAEIPADWGVEGQELLYAVGADGVDVGKQMAGRFCGEGEKTGLIKTD